MRSFYFFLYTLFCLALMSGFAFAQVPQTLTYSGLLSEGGVPAEASVRLTFTLYDAAAGGNNVWSETFDNVDVENGHFTVALGSSESITPVLDGNIYWLEVSVNDGPGLLPRSAFDSVPYALKAKDADTISGQTIQQIQNGVVQTSIDVAYNNNSSGLNATTVQSAVDELASRSVPVTLPHALTHQNGGSDEINVAGLNGLLADPQTPATHDHDSRYYTEAEVDATVVKKVDARAQTFTFTFTDGSSGSPFVCPTAGGVPSGAIPLINVSITNFVYTAPRFFYNYNISGDTVTVRVYNIDGAEILPQTVTAYDWADVEVRIDIVWMSL